MSKLSNPPVFCFQTHQVRIIIEGEQIWFVGKDVCRALNIPWRGNTLNNIPCDWKRTMRKFRMEGFATRDLVVISEPALYKLAFRSNKPEADVFTDWVASEVLPSIRQTGKYEAKPKPKALPKPSPLSSVPSLSADEARFYWLKALDIHTSMCEISNHVINCCDKLLRNSREQLETARHLLDEARK